MKQFKYEDIHKLEANLYWFERAMISTCDPLFNDYSDNYEVEAELRKEKVIVPKNKTDTESCALVINFSNESSGHKFIDRLNAYLHKKSLI
jgi:hypothetical protein